MKTLAKLQFRWYVHNRNIAQLATYLQSTSYKVRRMAAFELGKLEDVAAIPYLLELMNDAVLKVAETALCAVQKIVKTNNLSIDISEHERRLSQMKEKELQDNCKRIALKFDKRSHASSPMTTNPMQIPAWLQF